MRGADQASLGGDFLESAQQEAAKAAGLFDLAEDWLDRLLAQPVASTLRTSNAKHNKIAHRPAPRRQRRLPLGVRTK